VDLCAASGTAKAAANGGADFYPVFRFILTHTIPISQQGNKT